jgi:hypothetical protein
VREVAEDDVVDLVEEDAAEVLGLGDEGVDVDVEVEAAVEEGDGHARDGGIGDGGEAGEDGGVVGVAGEEGAVLDEGGEEGGDVAGLGHGPGGLARARGAC